MEWLKSVHFYRKVPRDLTEATTGGGTLSLASTVIMVYLFYTNFSAFLTVNTRTSIMLDSSNEKKLQINFNVTLHHLPCQYASLDIVDVMGTHIQNVSSNVLKTRVGADGGLLGHVFREPKAVVTAEPRGGKAEDVPQVSPELDEVSFMKLAKAKKLLLVNFYAPWCPWSQRLAPVWEEAYANVMKGEHSFDAWMAKADCTGASQQLCQRQHVHAFPTVRVYRQGNAHSHETYVGDRTHEAIESFIASNVHDLDHTEAVSEGLSVQVQAGEGCIMRGVALVNRVPGNFHISAHSKSHSFSGHALNMSHTITSMSFGKMLSATQLRLLPAEVGEAYNGLRNTVHHIPSQNTTLEHFLKVVHTSYEMRGASTLETYQYSVNHNAYAEGDSLPSAVFSYDISPMQVVVAEQVTSLATFLTRICAIIGGVFTVTGLLDGALYYGGATLRRKMEIGKAA